jgi:hypothetical protein
MVSKDGSRGISSCASGLIREELDLPKQQRGATQKKKNKYT